MDTKNNFMPLLDGMDAETVDLMIEFLKRYRASMPDAKKCAETANREERMTDEMFLKQEVTRHLRVIGVPEHIKGYNYLRTALVAVAKDETMADGVTKILYPYVAKEYKTTPSRVERAIRHAIEVAWERCDLNVLMGYFGNTISREKGKTTNSEFLAAISHRMRDDLERYKA